MGNGLRDKVEEELVRGGGKRRGRERDRKGSEVEGITGKGRRVFRGRGKQTGKREKRENK